MSAMVRVTPEYLPTGNVEIATNVDTLEAVGWGRQLASVVPLRGASSHHLRG